MTPLRADPQSIVIFRALQLGDLLCAVPALRALRCRFPKAKIELVGLPWASALADRFPRYIDRFLEFPGFPGLPEQHFDSDRLAAFISYCARRKVDLAIQMQGNGTISNSILPLLGAHHYAGYFIRDQYRPEPGTFIPYPQEEPEIWRHLRLAEALGAPAQGDFLEFEITRDDQSRLHAVPGVSHLHFNQYVCIHPGARAQHRRWDTKHFAEVAHALASRGFEIVLTGSPSEGDLVHTVSSMLSIPHLNLAGKTDLGSMAALLSGARLLVCNDTGVSHLAAALAIPSVVVFTRSERHGWPPMDRTKHQVVARIGGVLPSDVIRCADRALGGREDLCRAS